MVKRLVVTSVIEKKNTTSSLTMLTYILLAGVMNSFDDMNLERLRLKMAMKTPEDHMFNFDPKTIDWDDYFTKIHIPGVLKYLCK
jgi:hypothetical protein